MIEISVTVYAVIMFSLGFVCGLALLLLIQDFNRFMQEDV